ncbi:MAG: choice-of-anchor D domain-containing protein [Terriglobales bacterium]
MPNRYSLGLLLAAIVLLAGCGGTPTGSRSLSGSRLMASSAVQFGVVPVGGTRSSSVAISNPARDGVRITVSQINIAGPGFALGDMPSFPMVIPAGGSVTVGIQFSPRLSGAAKGKVSIMSDAVNPVLPVSLTGNGNSGTPITVSPSALNFGSVGIGSSAVQSGTLVAGSSPVTVSTVNQSGAGYALSGISFPVTLAAGQQLPFSVTFTPQSAGTSTGSLSFVTDTPSSPAESLTGSGTSTSPSQHSVTLSWSATTSADGYNIYRSSQSGGPYAKLNSSPTSLTSYGDNAVQSGATYYYVATSVSGSQESGYSNQTVATIP